MTRDAPHPAASPAMLDGRLARTAQKWDATAHDLLERYLCVVCAMAALTALRGTPHRRPRPHARPRAI